MPKASAGAVCNVERWCLVDAMTGLCVHCGRPWRLVRMNPDGKRPNGSMRQAAAALPRSRVRPDELDVWESLQRGELYREMQARLSLSQSRVTWLTKRMAQRAGYDDPPKEESHD